MTLATRPHWRCSTTRREGTCSGGRGAGASQGLQPQSSGTHSRAPDGQTLPQTLGPSKLGPGITDSADKGLSSELEEAKGREPIDAEPTDGVAPADQNSTHPPGLGGAGVGRACIQTSHASAWEPSSAQPRPTIHDPRPTDSHRSRHSHGWNCEGPGRGRCTAGHTQAQLGDWLPQAANRSRAGAARWWEVGPAQRTARSRHAPGPREHRQGGQMDAAWTGARGGAGLCGFGT